MTSDKQFAANRANATKSTGPKTDAGKATSSLNAVTHGATAQTVVLPGEDPSKFQELRDAFFAQYKPETATLNALVDQLAHAVWRAKRIPAIERALLQWQLLEEERWDQARYERNIARRGKWDDPRPTEAGMMPEGETKEVEQTLALGRVIAKAIDKNYLSRLADLDAKLLRQVLKLTAEIERQQGTNARQKAASGN